MSSEKKTEGQKKIFEEKKDSFWERLKLEKKKQCELLSMFFTILIISRISCSKSFINI
jgi:hypothetical protein